MRTHKTDVSFEGVWSVQKMTMNGVPQPRESIEGYLFRFSKNTVQVITKNSSVDYEFKCNCEGRPMHFDMYYGKGVNPGIVSLSEEGELRIFLSPPNAKTRPSDFECKKGDHCVLYELRREPSR
jgi:uncharacterized protein (TIGR03067 family)